ncbi:MAG: hypothetical protein GDA54_04545 [Alphaproteobacteria bacterium GM7ARS4]|nr:hypothetical protein [Alphaproteobacteria bacterium GM7ARS4]
MRRHRATFLILMMACLAVTSCSTIKDAASHRKLHEGLAKPMVKRETRSFFLHLSQATPLAPQLPMIARIVESQGSPSKLTYRITPLDGDMSHRAIGAVRHYILDLGARARDISVHVSGAPAGHLLNAPLPAQDGKSVMVSVDRYVVLPLSCLDVAQIHQVGGNISSPNLRSGCVVEHNRATQAAYPQDLYRAQQLEPALSPRSASAVERYEEGSGGGEQGGGLVGGGAFGGQ